MAMRRFEPTQKDVQAYSEMFHHGSTKAFKETDQWKFSQYIEDLVSYRLKMRGEHVIATSECDKKGAPMIASLLKKHVVPDLQAMGNGYTRWWEVKGKARTDLYGKAKTHRTGAMDRHIADYVKVEQISGLPCWMAFTHANEIDLERGTARVYCQSLDVLLDFVEHADPSHHHPTGMPVGQSGGYPTTYFDIDWFIWDEVLSHQLVEDIRKHVIPPKNICYWQDPDFRGPNFRQNILGFKW